MVPSYGAGQFVGTVVAGMGALSLAPRRVGREACRWFANTKEPVCNSTTAARWSKNKLAMHNFLASFFVLAKVYRHDVLACGLKRKAVRQRADKR